MRITLKEYNDKTQEIIAKHFNEYLHVIVGLCNSRVPSPEDIKTYFDNEEVMLTREMVNLIEGCAQAFFNVIGAKIEYYNPCRNLMNDINRNIYNGNSFNSSTMFEEGGMKYVMEESKLFDKLTHAEDIKGIFYPMTEILKHNIFKKYNHATLVLYVEAILLYNFDCIWNLPMISVSDFRNAISYARTGNDAFLYKLYINNITYLTEQEDSHEC